MKVFSEFKAETGRKDVKEKMSRKMMTKIGAAAVAAVMALGMLGGCKQLETKTPENTVAATFGGEKVMLKELNYYIQDQEYDWEKANGSTIMTASLSGGGTLGDYLKNSVLTQLHQTMVLGEYAGKNGIALDDAQMEKVNAAVDAYMTDEAEKVAAIGADRETVLKAFTANALANEVFLELVKDVDTTVGDDEFIRKEITFVKLTPSEITAAPTTTAAPEPATSAAEENEEGETAAEESGAEEPAEAETEAPVEAEPAEEGEEATEGEEETTLSAEEVARSEAMAQAAAEIQENFDNGEKPYDFIEDYRSSSYYSTTYSTKTIGEDGTDAYNEAAWALNEGETTIYNAEDGSIYIIVCVNDNDEEARKTAIAQEIERRKGDLFSQKYADIQTAASKFTVDQDVLATIAFLTPVYVEPETSTEAASEEAEAISEAVEEAVSEAEEVVSEAVEEAVSEAEEAISEAVEEAVSAAEEVVSEAEEGESETEA